MSTELYIPTVRRTTNPTNGQYLKGHVPHNKGKQWNDYMGKRAQKKCSKGWKNLDHYRTENGKKHGGRNRKPIVAITDDGKFRVFKDSYLAAEWFKKYTGKSCNRENIGRCCRDNASRKVCKHSWRPGQKKGSTTINTDHRYMGVRWYYESDTTWYAKISK